MSELTDLEDLLCKKSAKRKFRQFIFEAFGNECAYCGISYSDNKENLTLDHVKSTFSGGETTTFNLIPACRTCNQNKGSKEWKSWYRKEAGWLEESEEKIQDWLNCSKQE
jgi:5-methylcytosine-specific restriction endonuclease McrA